MFLSYLAARYRARAVVLHTRLTVYEHGHVETEGYLAPVVDITPLHHIKFGTGGSSPGPVAHGFEHENVPALMIIKKGNGILFCLGKE